MFCQPCGVPMRLINSLRSRVLVASGRLRFRAAGTSTLNILLSGAGRRLLGSVGHIRVTAKCAFTPTGFAPVRASATFVLKR